MSLPRHFGLYLEPIYGHATSAQARPWALGGVQLLLDWGVMVGVSALGISVVWANLAGRISGALLGFWLNGRYTFADVGAGPGRIQLQRFLLMWLATTVASTWAVSHVDAIFGLQWAWLAKPVIDAALALIQFVLSRHWVYRGRA